MNRIISVAAPGFGLTGEWEGGVNFVENHDDG